MRVEIRDLQDKPLPLDRLRDAAIETARTAELRLDCLSVVLVDDERMRELNHRFRNLDRPTDVLSFEAEPQGDEVSGEVILSVPTAERQAQEAGHGLEAELAWLVAHGVLHLAGMDDETEPDLEHMLHLQRNILKSMGIKLSS